ncbi:MAG: sigma-70 family RNA polymerase sigma factor [Candidatus Latescibacteria bacterium]|nr:sigma-70 family RNA polymerase sigma factor [Candidatus Latescibacterota bacterium]
MEKQDERHLIEQAKTGNGLAFDELTRRYLEKAYSLAYQMLSHPDDARDLVQDAFLEVYRTLDRFNTQYRFSTWLYRILINKCINHRKRETRRRMLSLSDLLSHRENGEATALSVDLRAHPKTPHDLLEQDELQRAIADALNALSERHRTVVVLFDLEGFSHKQIAEILRCPEGTVMSRLHHGRLKLKSLLSKRLKGYF